MIRRILLAARKDLLRRWRSPLAVGSILAFPVILSVILALVFGGKGGHSAPRLLVDNRDSGPSGLELLELAGRPEWQGYLELITVEREQGQRRLEANTADAMLCIPEGFTLDRLAGREPTLELIRNPARSINPELIERTLKALLIVMEQEATSPPATTVSTVEVPGEPRAGGGSRAIFLIVLPGISIWALFMVGDIGMRDVLTEAAEGTLRRQLSSRFTVSQLLMAKCLSTAALAGISWLLLCAIGFWALDRSIDVVAFLLLSVSLVLAVTGFSSVIYGLVRTERQGATFSTAGVLLMSLVGGAFIPAESLPPALRAISPISPVYWATSAFSRLLQEGAGLGGVAAAAAALTLLGVFTLAIGSRLLHRALLKGRLA